VKPLDGNNVSSESITGDSDDLYLVGMRHCLAGGMVTVLLILSITLLPIKSGAEEFTVFEANIMDL